MGATPVSQRAGIGRRSQFVWILLLHVCALTVFVHGYLLTRLHLKQRSTEYEAGCSKPYSKLVWVVIDALRYDFVVSDARYPCAGAACGHQGNMPALSALLRHAHAAKAYRYIADAPTTTTQRLKAMVSGGLPTFFDISSTFTAGAMDEDNLVAQLAAADKRLVFMGDATWDSLFPAHFNLSLPFPCFNVKDLDSVDDGVWEHLLPTLRRPAAWDVLVAHYLGVDHAGHSHGVRSARMAAKVAQMDAHVAAVVAEMVGGAGAGGAYEDALLLVSGDHGQTLGGDHGGGSPEEVDSVLVAIDLAALRATQHAGHGSGGGTLVSACRADCTCGADGNQCAEDLPQIDLVPTVAAVLGVPVPFVNLGKVAPELWSLAAGRCRREGERRGAALARATAANARQVHAYLSAYAGLRAARFPRAVMRRLDAAFAQRSGEAEGRCAAAADCGAAADLAFLAEANEVARQVWTRFHEPSMVAGLALFASALAYHAAAAWAACGAERGAPSPSPSLALTPAGALAAVLAAGPFAQAAGIFSFFYLLSEGRMVSVVLASMTVVLAAWSCFGPAHSSGVARPALLGVVALACNAGMAALGLARHSGYGFWQRLTVHEPADAGPAAGAAAASPVPPLATSLFGEAVLLWAGVPAGASSAFAAVVSHLMTYTGPILVLSALAGRRLRSAPLLRSLTHAAYVAVALHHVLELAVQQAWVGAGATPASALQLLLSRAPGGRDLLPVVMAVAARAPFMALPLHLLLPRLALALCAAVAAALAVQSARRGSGRVAEGFGALIMALVLLTASSRPPLVPLLGVAQLTAVTALLAALARCGEGAYAGSAAVASLLAVAQTQAYFVTGHLCEFAGLQYTAAFIGFDEFHLYRSAVLLAVDTFGGMVLVVLALPAIAKAAHGGAVPLAGVDRRDGQPRNSDEGLQSTLLLFGLARAASAFCATLSAAVQRRHLYAWALFAPKFVFEVLFLLLTDALLLLLAP